MTKLTEGVDVIIRDLSLNPRCPHGPTILFSTKSGRKFFACSGNRSQNECFRSDLDYDVPMQHTDDNLEPEGESIDIKYEQVLEMTPDQRIYCKTCLTFIKTPRGHESHILIRSISDSFMKEPSLHLPQLSDDQFNAQYFFDDHTLDFLCSIFEELKLTSIICMGAPRLHDYIKTRKPKMNSILLDIDSRFKAFNSPEAFCQYNMFNHYFFRKSDEEKFKQFLNNDSDVSARSNHCLFTDPPFAARTELLSETIRTISSTFHQIRPKILPVMWIFPYFNEHHIKKMMPEMEMLDFQVTYMNHRAYCDQYKGRKEGSPIRIFTNIDPKFIKYPSRFISYHLCRPCNRFVSNNNEHCKICKICPSKNGATYRHCQECIKCVKPNYVHCSACGRCAQKYHDCTIYQQHQECWFCMKYGHVEIKCEQARTLFKSRKHKNGICIVCKGNTKHNLKVCPSKLKFLSN